MKVNWFYFFILILAGVMLFVSLKFFRGSRHSSVGVAYAKEYKINADKSSVIKGIHVVSGQQVKKGDVLIELTSTSLDMDIEKLANRIEVLRAEQTENAKVAQSRIAFTRAEQGVVISEMKSSIVQAESEMKLNKRLTRQYADKTDSLEEENPVVVKLQALKQQLVKQEEALSIRVQSIIQQNQSEQNALSGQIDLLEKELALLKNERSSLNKYASADGVVQNIYVRPGEQVDAYTSLLSIHPQHPATVIGYMVGRKEELAVGASVSIQSFEKSDLASNGKVIGYGAFVELPEILQKSTATKAFGREIFIEIPPDNDFASGEKVLIR
jgi:multidrug resistance efflux pump